VFMNPEPKRPWVALACGGTGGHLFPGIAVGEVLAAHGCAVTLMISSKEIDRRGASLAPQFECITLPAVGLERGRELEFLRCGWSSYRTASRAFRARRPAAVLAMGGFTAAAPILAGRRLGAATFLHESNSIPGRANRWLARWVDRAFVGFPQTAARLKHCGISVTGTPVRARFGTVAKERCRLALGLDPDDPVLLVMGGSQGASAINDLVLGALPRLHQQLPGLQIIHLTGVGNHSRVEQAYRGWQGRVLVKDFAAEMEIIMGASTLAISRAGASTLAELAASGLVSVLVPYPWASDNHQYYNARALADTGAARILEEGAASPAALASTVKEMLDNAETRRLMRVALSRWHRSEAALQIAAEIMERIGMSLLRQVEAGSASLPGATLGDGGVSRPAPGEVKRELQESWHG
jgi:UDP-N-acetylglucosamine--N-acetylmuramyl-(pentapeptide) pyrophosphoryl-undecaprenol N-acetylglucosamine transferase